MTAWLGLLAALAIALCALPARAAEPPQPLTAKEWVMRRTMSRFGTYAEVCKRHMPGMGGAWDRALAGIGDTVGRLTDQQLATARFAALGAASLPVATAAPRLLAVEKASAALAHRLEARDPYAHCPPFLRNAQDVDDEALRPIVIEALSGFQAMLAGARPAP
jgi:hypothetical protein